MSAQRTQPDHSRIRALWVAFGLTCSVLIVESAAAVISGSLTLWADAGHMLTDVLGLVVALVCGHIASRPANAEQTFGYRRAEVLGAFVNALLLIAIGIWVLVQAFVRALSGVHEVHGAAMIVAAAVALVANICSWLVLHRHSAESMNARGALLEVLGDLYGSAVALTAGIVILLTGWGEADLIASLLIAVLIIPRALALLRSVIKVLLESTPEGVDITRMREHLQKVPGVVRIHDMHAWSVVPTERVVTAHIVVDAAVLTRDGADAVLDRLDGCLAQHFGVAHTTFQIEPAGHADHEADLHA